MQDSDGQSNSSRLWLFLLPTILVITAVVDVPRFEAGGREQDASATYAHGILDLTIPYHLGSTIGMPNSQSC